MELSLAVFCFLDPITVLVNGLGLKSNTGFGIGSGCYKLVQTPEAIEVRRNLPKGLSIRTISLGWGFG